MAHARIEQLLVLIDQAFEKRAWHGTTLKGSFRGMDIETALWRPHPSRHNAWEYLLHCAFWKHAARRMIGGDPDAAFDRKPKDWPRPPPDPTQKDFERDKKFLKHHHLLYRAQVAAFPASKLDERRGGPTNLDIIHGVAAHDLYHCGQIQLLKRLKKAGA